MISADFRFTRVVIFGDAEPTISATPSSPKVDTYVDPGQESIRITPRMERRDPASSQRRPVAAG